MEELISFLGKNLCSISYKEWTDGTWKWSLSYGDEEKGISRCLFDKSLEKVLNAAVKLKQQTYGSNR